MRLMKTILGEQFLTSLKETDTVFPLHVSLSSSPSHIQPLYQYASLLKRVAQVRRVESQLNLRLR